MDDLVDWLQAANHPLSTDVSVGAIDDLDNRPPELVALLRRVQAGATEAARRLAGLPAAGWADEPGLLEAARSVGRTSWSLRQLDPDEPDDDWMDEPSGPGSRGGRRSRRLIGGLRPAPSLLAVAAASTGRSRTSRSRHQSMSVLEKICQARRLLAVRLNTMYTVSPNR